jgi:hypothetical protein
LNFNYCKYCFFRKILSGEWNCFRSLSIRLANGSWGSQIPRREFRDSSGHIWIVFFRRPRESSHRD